MNRRASSATVLCASFFFACGTENDDARWFTGAIDGTDVALALVANADEVRVYTIPDFSNK